MPYRITKNAPYNLLTEEGRAQAYVYSPQGAALATAVETAMLTTLEEVSEELDQLINKAMLDIATDARADGDLEVGFETFHSELGRRDKAEFEQLLETYKAERKFRNENLDKVLTLVRDIQKMFNIEG